MRENRNGPWYLDGLQFECTGCGECCRGPGGYVWVSMDEARQLAAALGMGIEDFSKKMLRKAVVGLALVDDAKGDCPLLGEDGRCRVYECRPMQCRTWPWWNENLRRPEAWEEAARRCPGMNRGKRHGVAHIDSERTKEF